MPQIETMRISAQPCSSLSPLERVTTTFCLVFRPHERGGKWTRGRTFPDAARTEAPSTGSVALPRKIVNPFQTAGMEGDCAKAHLRLVGRCLGMRHLLQGDAQEVGQFFGGAHDVLHCFGAQESGFARVSALFSAISCSPSRRVVATSLMQVSLSICCALTWMGAAITRRNCLRWPAWRSGCVCLSIRRASFRHIGLQKGWNKNMREIQIKAVYAS